VSSTSKIFPEIKHLAPGESFFKLYSASQEEQNIERNFFDKILPPSQPTQHHSETFQCDLCGRNFANRGGRTRHRNHSLKKDDALAEQTAKSKNELTSQKKSDEVTLQKQADAVMPQDKAEKFASESLDHQHKWISSVQDAYEKAVHWRRNLFQLPKGKSSKDFIAEMVKLIGSWNSKSPIRSKNQSRIKRP